MCFVIECVSGGENMYFSEGFEGVWVNVVFDFFCVFNVWIRVGGEKVYDNLLVFIGVWYIVVFFWCEVKSNCFFRVLGGCGDELELVEGIVWLFCIFCMGFMGIIWVFGGVSVCNDIKIEW